MNNRYRQRITQVLAYIDTHISSPLSLDHLASVGCFSPYHFHRVFKGAMNETLNDYVNRRKLECAVSKLVTDKHSSITTIALQLGYSSSANFSKAVKQYFGVTASQIRRGETNDSNIGNIVSKYRKSFDPARLYSESTYSIPSTEYNRVDTMNVQVKELDAQVLCKLASDGGYAPNALFATWDQLINWGEQRGFVAERQVRYAKCYDNPAVTPIERCRYEACLAVDNSVTVVDPFVEDVLAAGTYAVLRVKGGPDDVAKAQTYLFSGWLPTSGYEPDQYPMVERYLNDARVDGFADIEIMFKLKPLG